MNQFIRHLGVQALCNIVPSQISSSTVAIAYVPGGGASGRMITIL